MTDFCYVLKNERATQAFAAYFSQFLSKGYVVGLSGEIGMGKTSFVRALLKTLGVQSSVKSPTFNLVESYDLPFATVYHFDLYRLTDEFELEDLGVRDYLVSDSICLVEWPEKAPSLMSMLDILFEFELEATGRKLKLKALSENGYLLLESMKRKPWLSG
jgi:tRNA threonylcarbamoyladenosine biosynthesis protein TsaE